MNNNEPDLNIDTLNASWKEGWNRGYKDGYNQCREDVGTKRRLYLNSRRMINSDGFIMFFLTCSEAGKALFFISVGMVLFSLADYFLK